MAVRELEPMAEQNTKIKSHNIFSEYLMSLLSLQYDLNRVLLSNSILADQFIKQSNESNGKTSSSEGSTLVSGR